MSESVDRALYRLTRAPGVRGAMVVDAEAGVVVAAELADGEEEKPLAALAASLLARTTGATRTARFGDVRMLQLDGTDGHVVAASAGPLLVVAVTDRNAQLGLVRVEAGRAAEALS